MKFSGLCIALILIFALGHSTSVYAQDSIEVENPPVNFELMPASNGLFAQIVAVKRFKSAPRWGISSVTNVITNWGHKEPDDFMSQSSLTFEAFKNFEIAAGYYYAESTGIFPSLMLIYSFQKEDWLLSLMPRIELARGADYEIYGTFSYTPEINDTFSLYTRLDGLYTVSVSESIHQRSYIWARAGLSYKEFAFGLGANLDFYGPDKTNINNYGVFVNVDLF